MGRWISILILCAFYTAIWSSLPGFVSGTDKDLDDGVTVETEPEEVLEQYTSPSDESPNIYFAEHFDDEAKFYKKWIKSQAKKQGVDENIAKYNGEWAIQEPNRRIFKGDHGLVLVSEAKHAAISAPLRKPFVFNDKPLIVQYEVTMQEGQNCGGAYLKLLSQEKNSAAPDLKKFYDQTPYTIMFGPDKCGNDNKIHFIFRHKNPVNGTMEEKHGKRVEQRIEDFFKDKAPHLYTLILSPDNTFRILVDREEVHAGSLLEDMQPPVNPPEFIDDPSDQKPQDWDERAKIPDPAASKPEDWDESEPQEIVDASAKKPYGWLDNEPEMVADPDSVKPDDWDVDMDGDWEPALIENPACASAPGCGDWKQPTIPNPSYKGIWKAPLIPNPNYRGKWSPRQINNPDYFRDDQPFRMTTISAVGFELWSMSPKLLFDNLIITDDFQISERWAEQSFVLKQAKLTQEAASLWGRIMKSLDYKPGWWGLYFVYCSLPIAAYVCFLHRRFNEETFVGRAMEYFRLHPAIVIVVGIMVLLSIVIFFVYICSTDNKPEEDDIAKSKKTDAVTADDPRPADLDSQDAEGEELGEGEEDENEVEEDGSEEQEQTSTTSRPNKQQLEEPVKAEVKEQTNGSGDGQRKRKPRKE